MASILGMAVPGSGGYDFVNLTVFMVALYAASFILHRTGRMTIRTHRMIWNIMLLFTFALSTFLGVLLLLRINYGIAFSLPFNMLYWHVEAGMAMAVISVFHISWHAEYFKCLMRRAVSVCETSKGGGREARRRGDNS